jgi:hypothetical protein
MIGSLFFVALSIFSQQQGNEWDRADLATVRLEPDAFPNLPAAVRSDLKKRACTIPQPFTSSRPENVIRGRFFATNRTDWAVLCSRSRRSSILVYRQGAPQSVVELASRPDMDFLQVIGPGRIGFSRAIAVATPTYIREKRVRYGIEQPRSIQHDGVNDTFVEKGSVVWYYFGGKWVQLPGAD